ncbi:MAG: phosphoribosylformylglycinamidine cyclo-ligase [Candidatus Altiarchaeota archaeon]
MTYAKAGVNIAKLEDSKDSIVEILEKTFKFRRDKFGEVQLDIGTFANLIDIGNENLLAFTTDGVGTKVLIAQKFDKYDTIGIDLVAMLVNDLICLGAEPVAMVDYIALEKVDKNILKEIAKGIYNGAKIANIAVVGGETASLPDIIKGVKGKGFDLAGAAIGVVKKEKVIDGRKISPNDIVLGVKSSGIHSNGLSLARKVLPENMQIDLLKPTKIYSNLILEILKEFEVNGLANITGGGFRNLQRITSFGFILDNLPKTPKVFQRIQRFGNISLKEMLQTFNMGVGFCIIADEKNANRILMKYSRGYGIMRIGKVIHERGVIVIKNGKKIKLDN